MIQAGHDGRLSIPRLLDNCVRSMQSSICFLVHLPVQKKRWLINYCFTSKNKSHECAIDWFGLRMMVDSLFLEFLCAVSSSPSFLVYAVFNLLSSTKKRWLLQLFYEQEQKSWMWRLIHWFLFGMLTDSLFLEFHVLHLLHGKYFVSRSKPALKKIICLESILRCRLCGARYLYIIAPYQKGWWAVLEQCML